MRLVFGNMKKLQFVSACEMDEAQDHVSPLLNVSRSARKMQHLVCGVWGGSVFAQIGNGSREFPSPSFCRISSWSTKTQDGDAKASRLWDLQAVPWSRDFPVIPSPSETVGCPWEGVRWDQSRSSPLVRPLQLAVCVHMRRGFIIFSTFESPTPILCSRDSWEPLPSFWRQ